MLCCPDDLTPAHLSTQDTRHSIRFERVSHLNHANTTRHQHEAKFARGIRRFVFVQVAKGLAIPSYPSYRPPSLRHGFVLSQTCRIVPCVPRARTRKSYSGKPLIISPQALPDLIFTLQHKRVGSQPKAGPSRVTYTTIRESSPPRHERQIHGSYSGAGTGAGPHPLGRHATPYQSPVNIKQGSQLSHRPTPMFRQFSRFREDVDKDVVSEAFCEGP